MGSHKKFAHAILSFVLLATTFVVQAAPATIDFESLSDSESLSNQIAGLTFSNATVLTAGLSLNEFEFPPSSGQNAVFDDGGPLTINFSAPVDSISALITYSVSLTFKAFDAGLNLVASDSSNFMSNLGLSGNAGSSPNETFSVSFAGGISRLVIEGYPSGGSLVLDDLTIDLGPPNPTPEPGTTMLMTISLMALSAVRRLKRQT